MGAVSGLAIALAAGAIATFVGLGYAVRRHPSPCPSSLIVLLENRWMEKRAGSTTLLDRAGVGPGMRILDVGCGPGRLSLPAAVRVGLEGEVVALDIQPSMLQVLEARMAERGVTNVRTVLAGAGDGKVERGAFDRVLLVTVLGEIPDGPRALREAFDALKPGGLLSVTEVLPDPHYQSRATVRRLAEQAGLEFVESFGNVLAFTLNFVKPDALPR
jgi:ubiquinone/menaquinone biosynthesis C-methylase UbiE